MNLCLNVCILIGKSLAVFRDSYFSPISFYVKNAKIDFFLENMILSALLIDFKFMRLYSGLADLEKHQTLAFLLMVDLLRLFKITLFFLDF